MTTKAIQSAAANAFGPWRFVEKPPGVQSLSSRVAELSTCPINLAMKCPTPPDFAGMKTRGFDSSGLARAELQSKRWPSVQEVCRYNFLRSMGRMYLSGVAFLSDGNPGCVSLDHEGQKLAHPKTQRRKGGRIPPSSGLGVFAS